jgi:hypothetical protein
VAYNPAQVDAVRKVLYRRDRLIKLYDQITSIEALMNLDPHAKASPGSITRPGTGPSWFIRANGKVSPSVIEAANRCDKIADLLLETRADLAHVDFPASDKGHLRAALAEQAAAWRARGRAWRAPGKPNVGAAVAPIEAHVKKSIREFQHVTLYMHDAPDPTGVH